MTPVDAKKLERRANDVDRGSRVALDEGGGEPKHANAEAGEPCIARRIAPPSHLAGVNAAIDLDDEPVSRTVEIDDDADRERMLPPKARPESAPTGEPKEALRSE